MRTVVRWRAGVRYLDSRADGLVGVAEVIDTLFDALLLCLLVTVATLILGLPLVMVGAHVARERHPQEYADWAAENPPTPPLFKPPHDYIAGDAHARTLPTESIYDVESEDNDYSLSDMRPSGSHDGSFKHFNDWHAGWTVKTIHDDIDRRSDFHRN